METNLTPVDAVQDTRRSHYRQDIVYCWDLQDPPHEPLEQHQIVWTVNSIITTLCFGLGPQAAKDLHSMHWFSLELGAKPCRMLR
jgi:hypothetical protein